VSKPIFIDTSAIYAFLDREDLNHSAAANLLGAHATRGASGDEHLVTHSGVVIETVALLARRLGFEAVRQFQDSVIPAIEVCWVDSSLHGRAMAALLAAGRRSVSLVDWMSFELMREQGIDTALAFDEDFEAQGFTIYTV
jgi:predicted nucleic acid-binding protein